jgi:hypothetical protein
MRPGRAVGKVEKTLHLSGADRDRPFVATSLPDVLADSPRDPHVDAVPLR